MKNTKTANARYEMMRTNDARMSCKPNNPPLDPRVKPEEDDEGGHLESAAEEALPTTGRKRPPALMRRARAGPNVVRICREHE